MPRPIGNSGLNPNAHAFKPGEPWKGPAPKPGLNPNAKEFKPGQPPVAGSPAAPGAKPDLRIQIPDRPPASPSHGGRSDSPPKSQEEWDMLSQNLRQHQSLAPRDVFERPTRPLNPMRPPATERATAKDVASDMTEKKKTKSDMAMFFDKDIPHEPAGKRPPTPGEQVVLKDFDKQRRSYRDSETGENFTDLRNRGEFSATYDTRPKPDGTGRTAIRREFNYDRGNTSHMASGDAIPPHMRVHSHPDFTLPFPSPQDHRVAAANYASHGEKNYLVTPENKVYQFGPSKDGPQYTQLSPIDLKTPTEPAKGKTPAPQPAKEGSPNSASSTNSDEYWADFKAQT